MSTLKIGGREIGTGNECFFVAEVGINHNGFVELAEKLVEAAVSAGCHAVKFQKRTVSVVYSKEDLDKKRQIPIINGIMSNAIHRGVLSEEAVKRLKDSRMEDTTNGDLKYALEFTREEYKRIDLFCRAKGILWFASPWDIGSVEFLNEFDSPCFKIASASLTDTELLSCVRQTGKPVILATGMSTLGEIESAVEILGKDNLVLLHAVSEYPPNDENLNLLMIKTLQDKFPGVPIGYSGHEKDILPSVIAASMGACLIERHLTLDRRMWGSDHAASLEPEELSKMVQQIKRIPGMLGDGVKTVSPGEREIMKKLRRRYGFGGG